MRRGYHGGSFDGNNANKILSQVDDLADSCPISCIQLVEVLRAFDPIVSGCFGDHLDPNFLDLFSNFQSVLVLTQESLKNHESGARLNCTWKVHILLVHLPVFLSHFQCGMSRFSEQCGESIHHAMKPSLARYLVSEEHLSHAEKLLRAVSAFSASCI